MNAADAGYAAWQRGVAGVLAKARGVDPDGLGDEPERLLDTTTYDGVTIRPLYTRADELPERTAPGVAPFVRGRSADRSESGWDVRARYTLEPGADPKQLNAEVLTGLENGVTSLWLGAGEADPAVALPAVLAGVHLDLAPIVLDAGAAFSHAAEALLGLVDDSVDVARIDFCLGADPLSRVGISAETESVDALSASVALAVAAAAHPGNVRTLLVDGTVFHNAGAGDCQELGAALAVGVAYLRALVSTGLSIEDALGQIDFRLAATDDQFQTIAKFRAARRLWSRVAEVLGAPSAGGMRQHAVTSAAMMTQRDPWVNLLRTTVASFAAGVGSADAVTTLRFDDAIPGGHPDVSAAFSDRMARNIQLLLLEESHIGRVRDPAGGSWYVEQLTDALATSSWSYFQKLEAAGGYQAAATKGQIKEDIATTRVRRDDDIAHRRKTLTAINEFADLNAPDWGTLGRPGGGQSSPILRYSSGFEGLRDRVDRAGSRPTVLLATLGNLAEYSGRATFVENLLASGGIAALLPGPLESADDVRDAALKAGLAVAIVCGSDKRYATDAAAAVAALRDAGVAHVLLAGPATAYDPGEAPGPDGTITARMDAIAALSELLDELGVA